MSRPGTRSPSVAAVFRQHRSNTLLTLLLVVGVACSDRNYEDGVYTLRSINNIPVPYNDLAGCCTYSSGSLRLDDGGYEIHLAFRNRQTLASDSVVESGTFRAHGVDLSFQLQSSTFPLSLYHGVQSHDTITVSFGGDGPGAQDQYRGVWVR